MCLVIGWVTAVSECFNWWVLLGYVGCPQCRLLHQCVLIQFAAFFALKSRASRAVRGQGSALPGQACEFGHRCCLPWMSGA